MSILIVVVSVVPFVYSDPETYLGILMVYIQKIEKNKRIKKMCGFKNNFRRRMKIQENMHHCIYKNTLVYLYTYSIYK